MRSATKCIVLMALADLASGFSFALTYTGVDRSVVSMASQSRALPRTVVRAAPLRLGGLQMTATKIPITITGTNIELTQPLKDYVNEKIGSALFKVGRKVIRCDVTLTINKNPSIELSQSIETVIVVKGATLRSKETTHDMYASIDAASDSVKRKLRKYKGKIIDAHRAGWPEGDDFDAEEIESFQESNTAFDMDTKTVPDTDMTVVKEKQFAMSPISTKEAVLCLEYLDHDFYVYRNAATSKISVVYKRKSGGVGLIEPE
mmetsp:Transcript_97497/g.157237  ORF Transcript_97497/g.157237 Transcript_97497/m.157237 type:complete len:261 (-) Transcript_97497:589-1371(-)|eukprot:CAMPEP_0179431088 /NCGR_PEP_ID=MMETSP0799-20121207/16063_1 /TAXON_ID=46947 /ORGANISM="Geminigera cryophila, Strain CCMP2564" /LENGTH=260 /DNA_ID=CAMNT_0021207839 /DNA_START=339 /DNA_END=1121 /DNA_ORIENTATION=+